MLPISILIFLLLVLATIVIAIRIRLYKEREDLINLKRIQTWWLICFTGITVFYFSGWALSALIIALTSWAVFELFDIQKTQSKSTVVLTLTLTIFIYTLLVKKFIYLDLLFFLLPIVFITYVLMGAQTHKSQSIAMLFFCVTSIHSLQIISAMERKLDCEVGALILFICFITAVNDISQYLCGKRFGIKKLAPTLSPNKTIEGAIGGIMIASLAASILLPSILEISWLLALGIGILIAVFGILGDLTFSYFKRKAKVKNYGSSLPGHGGLLDRIDSLMLAAPIFGLYLSILY